jgi:hypothetical protein
MEDLLRDVERRMAGDSRLDYIQQAGGIIVIPELVQFPDQTNAPAIVLIDNGASPVTHGSSRTRRRNLLLQIHAIQRVFIRGVPIKGNQNKRGVEEISKDIVSVLDMHRFNGKYNLAYLISEEIPTPFNTKNMHLQEKALTFRYVRLESS